MQKKFYRSQLATIVWDSENNCILADFKRGYFITSDKRTIRILKKLNYPEVEIESESPPKGLIVRQPSVELKGDVPIFSSNLSEKLAEKKFTEAIKPPVKKTSQKNDKKFKIKRLKGY